MQQIERYGVIALVFLLVTIVAVSFWGDSKSPGFWKRLTGRAVPQKQELAEAPPATSDRAIDNSLTLSPNAPTNPIALAPQGDAAGQNGVVAPAPAPSNTQQVGHGSFLPLPPEMVDGRGPAWQPPQSEPAPQPFPSPPVATAPQPAPQAPVASEYVVQKGDSLALIAQRSLGDGQRWKEISELNGGIEPKRLQVGMKLRLPHGSTAPARARELPVKAAIPRKEALATKPAPKKSGGVYVVKSGDTLRSIAEAKLGSSQRWKDILAANPGIDPSRIRVGQELRLPSGAQTASIASAVPAPARATSSSSSKPVVR